MGVSSPLEVMPNATTFDSRALCLTRLGRRGLRRGSKIIDEWPILYGRSAKVAVALGRHF
jgi:hypothetical protein